MFKKFLCGVVAAALVFTAAPVLPANTTVASAEAVKVTKAVVGNTDYSSKFWGDHSDAWKLDDGKVLTVEFENHSSDKNVYSNFDMVFCNQEERTNENRGTSYVEYAVVRADRYSWIMRGDQKVEHTTLDGKAVTYTEDYSPDGSDWTAPGSHFRNTIKDSNVKLVVTRQGNTVVAKAEITSISDPTKKLNYSATLSVAAAEGSTAISTLYVGLTVEECYMNIKSVDISSASEDIKISDPPKSDQKPAAKPGPSQKATQKAKFTVKKGKKKVSKVTVKKGKKVTLKVTVIPSKAKLSLVKLTKKQKKIATVTFKKGKLTIKGKKKGNVTVKITSSRQGVYKKTTKSIKVTVKK